MENSFDTSFIPQQPLLKVEGSPRKLEHVNVALVLAFVMFFVMLVVWGGMYFYKTSLDQRVAAGQKELDAKEAKLNTADIDRYKAIDQRLSVAKKLLNNHVAFSTLLTLLEKITAQDIGWTSLSYGSDNAGGPFQINLSGQAPSYAAVYAQAEAWRAMQDTLKSVEVSTPQLNPVSGVVSFSATLIVDPGYMNYARLLAQSAAIVNAPVPVVAAPAASSSTSTLPKK